MTDNPKAEALSAEQKIARWAEDVPPRSCTTSEGDHFSISFTQGQDTSTMSDTTRTTDPETPALSDARLAEIRAMVAKYGGPRLSLDAEPYCGWCGDDLIDGPCQCHSTMIPDLLAEVDRLRALTTWQPIETAPKDGTRVEVYGVNFRRHCFGIGYYVSGAPFDEEGWIAHVSYALPQNDVAGIMYPTHWRPLAVPPKSQESPE